MYGHIFLLVVILSPQLNAINVTNTGNLQEITDMKKDLTMLRNLVTSLNMSLQSIQSRQTEKDEQLMEMNVTIQDQQKNILSMESTIQNLRQENADIRLLHANSSAQIDMLQEVDMKTNQNYKAFQLIVQDLVTNVNTIRNTSQLQLGHIHDNLTSLANQAHYASLSLLDAEKMLKSLEDTTKETNKSISLQEQELSSLRSETKKNISSVFNNLRSQEQLIHDLSSETNKSLALHGQELSSLRTETEKNISSVYNNLKSQEQEIHDLSLGTKQNFTSVFNSLKSQGIRDHRSEGNGTIAFTVSSSSKLQNYNDKIIKYDKVFTNKGAAYNTNTGIFTCPTTGTYVFTWSTMSYTIPQSCDTYIYHNGNRLLESYSYESGGSYEEVASNTMVLTLTVGDRVWIQTSTGTYCHGYPFTGFSGWKI